MLYFTGTCECDPGYGSEDCSLKLSDPPKDTYMLIDDATCESNKETCTDVSLFGKNIAETSMLTCKFRSFVVCINLLQ